MEGTEELDELVWRNRTHHANFQFALFELREIPCQALSFKRILEDLLEMRSYHPTKFGEMRICPFAMKERAAEFVFEELDRARERWLSDVALLGSPREVQLVGHGQEIPDLVHLHSSPLSKR